MSIHLKKDRQLAELVGIILGDGHLKINYENSIYTCEIALNYVEVFKAKGGIGEVDNDLAKLKQALAKVDK